MAALQAPKHLTAILRHLPPVQYAFAYGSGVMHQPGLYESDVSATLSPPSPSAQGVNSQRGPMIDYFVAVDDPLAWHEQVISGA